MATVTPTTSEDDTATRRVRAYLRSLGVVDEIAVQRLADQLLASIPQNKDRSVRERLAMDAACGFKEVWYEAFSSCFDKDSPRHPDPLAGWRLWAIIRRQPEALLADPDVERINGIGEFGQGYAMPRVLERDALSAIRRVAGGAEEDILAVGRPAYEEVGTHIDASS
jgi:hypothetical protein